MGSKDELSNRKNADAQDREAQSANTLEQDIPEAADWVVRALNTSGYKADYSLESMKEIDRFFDEQSGPTGVISVNKTGWILFSLGAYVGQTVIKLYGGKWITNDDDPQGEVNIAVETADGVTLWPVIRCMKRYRNGSEDSIYALVYVLGRKKQ